MRTARALFALLVGAQLAYPRVPDRRKPAATRGMLGLMLAASAADAVAARGRRGAGLVAGAGLIGFGAELLGVHTGRPFGHYRYERKLGPRIAGVPVLAAVAWAVMARPAWVVAGLVDRRPARRVPLAAGALTAWDVFVDPRMAAEGYWTWPDGGRYAGVPAGNFVGWFVTGTVVFAVWAAVERDEDDPAGDGGGALALYAWTWAGESFANAVFWRRPLVAAAGCAAMGAFALPALAARRRALAR